MGFETNDRIGICQKNDGIDSNGVLDLIRGREQKDGFWMNGGIEKPNRFDSIKFDKRKREKRWVFDEWWITIQSKKRLV